MTSSHNNINVNVNVNVNNKNKNKDETYLTCKIPVQTYHKYPGKWIQFKRGPVYKEQSQQDEIERKVEKTGFQIVNYKKQKPMNIYYWYLHAHNLYPFDVLKADSNENDTNAGNNHIKIFKPWSKFKKYTLYFCQPDGEIYQNDGFPQNAIDVNKTDPVPLIFYAKHNGIKFKPITFIAKTEEQIKESLSHVKYCVVKELGVDKLQIVSEEDIRKEYDIEHN